LVIFNIIIAKMKAKVTAFTAVFSSISLHMFHAIRIETQRPIIYATKEDAIRGIRPRTILAKIIAITVTIEITKDPTVSPG